MKYLIIGRTGSGKDYIASKFSKQFNLKILESYTTRKPRVFGGPLSRAVETGHIFISKEEAAKLTDRIAEWKLGDIEYFATKQQLDESDIYIINPEAAIRLIKTFPEESFTIIYVKAKNRKKRHKMLKDRALLEYGYDNYKEGLEKYMERDRNETVEFCKFEETIYSTSLYRYLYNELYAFFRGPLYVVTHSYNNKYNIEVMSS